MCLVWSVLTSRMSSPPKQAMLLAKTTRGLPGGGAGGFEDVASAVEIHAQRVVEALLAFAADHRRQMEDRGGGLDCRWRRKRCRDR